MNNTGIEDEVIEAWVGQRNGMIEKIKTKNIIRIMITAAILFLKRSRIGFSPFNA